MDNNEIIQVPQSMVCANLNGFINRIYPGIGNSRTQDNQYFLDCIILCPRNDQVHDINEAILVRGPLIRDSGARSSPLERSCSRSNITT